MQTRNKRAATNARTATNAGTPATAADEIRPGKRGAEGRPAEDEPVAKKKAPANSMGGPPVASPSVAANPFTAGFRSSLVVQPTASIGTGQPVALKTGQAFSDHIRQMVGGSDEGVLTSIGLSVSSSRDAKVKAHPHEIGGSFSVATHPTTGLTQGMLDSSARSAYVSVDKDKQINEGNSVLPHDLTFDRAQLESRVIKGLSPPIGGAYDPAAKRSVYPELDFNGSREIKESVMGSIALGTYLEDITAARAVGLQNTGSALRATLMAAKWNMRASQLEKATDGSGQTTTGFRDNTMVAFPQLGKGTYAIDALNMKKTGISAMNTDWQKAAPAFTKARQAANIVDAHEAANNAAGRVFSNKFSATDDPDFSQRGKWWSANRATIESIHADHNSGDSKRMETAQTNFRTLSEAYRVRKLGRHDIER